MPPAPSPVLQTAAQEYIARAAAEALRLRGGAGQAGAAGELAAVAKQATQALATRVGVPNGGGGAFSSVVV